MDEAWTELTTDVVWNAFPTDLSALYSTWIDANPTKANRLDEVVAEVVTTFRRAVESNPANRVDPNPNMVPASGFRHALNSTIFNIGMEMGALFAPEVFTMITRADIWLRMVQRGSIPVDQTSSESGPSYTVPERERCLP